MKETREYKTDISFVILHYNVIDETINCVNSIKNNIDSNNYHIVIVDNASPNKSGDILLNKYKNDLTVSVILSRENVGFARGNNIGINYTINNLVSKYICCLNNDTLLFQTNFLEMIEKEYTASNAAVIGPMVFLKNNSVQSFAPRLLSVREYEQQLDKLINKKKIDTIKRYLLRFKIIRFINNIRKFNRKNKLREKQYNVVLHGCCLIFTPIFFSKLRGFNPKTFMFREEELLYLSLKKENLISLYSPLIKIKHLEDIATDSAYKNTKEKERFLISNQIKSLEILISELKNYEDERK